jgi:hypothetical protein
MHRDIQNFSQVMDINTQNCLVCDYKIQIHGTPQYKFYINNSLIEESGTLYFDLLDNLYFSCSTTGNGAIEIVSIKINGNEILPKYLHLANPKTNWIENNEYWEFHISKPFYAWYQTITGNGEIF